MMPSGVHVDVVEGASTRELRRRVLRPHFGPGDPLPGDDVANAVHIGAVDGDEVVGTCFVYESPCDWRPGVPAWRLKQMATAPERRGQGVGAAVLSVAHEVAAARGARLLWCHARETAVRFYAAHGWQPHGESFLDPELSIPHRLMSVELPGASVSSRG